MPPFIVTGEFKIHTIIILMLRKSVHVLFACIYYKLTKHGARIDGTPDRLNRVGERFVTGWCRGLLTAFWTAVMLHP